MYTPILFDCEATMSDDLLSVSEAAERLSVSPRTIQRYCKQGRLNYKWVTGTRHRELRIVPPIPVSELPGVKKHGISADEFVSADEFESAIASLNERLYDVVERLAAISSDIERLKSAGGGVSSGGAVSRADRDIIAKAGELVHDYNTVRPLEKKLILKMAKEVQAHSQFLRTLGMKDPESDD